MATTDMFEKAGEEFGVHRYGPLNSAEKILQDEMRFFNELIEKGAGNGLVIDELIQIGEIRTVLHHVWDRYNAEVCMR